MQRKLLVTLGGFVCLALVAWLVASDVASRREIRPLGPSCRGNLKRIAYACHLYSGDHDEAFPPSLGALFPEYISDGELFLCPSAGKAVEFRMSVLPEGATDASAVWSDRFTDYVYVRGLRASADQEFVLACDREDNHEGGRWVAFISGKVEWMKEPEFRAALAGTEAWLKEHHRPTPAAD